MRGLSSVDSLPRMSFATLRQPGPAPQRHHSNALMVTNKVTQRIDKNPSEGILLTVETAGFKPDIHPLTHPVDSVRAKALSTDSE